jgi:hypothetical protein
MAEMEYYLQKVIEAQDDMLDESQCKQLAEELEGALVGVSGNRNKEKLLGPIRSHNWNLLAGILRSRINDDQIRAAGGMVVNASASSSTVVNVDIAAGDMLDIYDAIDSCGELADAQKRDLKRLVAEMIDTTRSGDTAGFSHSAARWLEDTANLVTIWQAFAPVLLSLLNALVKQVPVSVS